MALDDLKKQLMAALAAGADEQSYGLSSKALPDSKKLMEEYPTTSSLSRVGSYLLPGLGEERLVGKLAQHLPSSLITKLLSSAGGKIESLAPGILSKLVSGTGQAAAQGAGTASLRNLLGGESNDVGESAKTGAMFGAPLSLLGAVSKKLAPGVYGHKSIPEELQPELLKEGVRGGKQEFLKKSGEFLGEHKAKSLPVIERLKSKLGTDVSIPLQDENISNALRSKINVGGLGGEVDTIREMKDRLAGLSGGLNEEGKQVTTINDLLKKQEDVNREIRKRYQFGESVPPGKGEGLEAVKKDIGNTIQGEIGSKLGQGELSTYKEGNKSYGKGMSLKNAMEDANDTFTPGVWDYTSPKHATVHAASKLLSPRTNLGVLLDRVGNANGGAQMTGRFSRQDKQAEPELSGYDEVFNEKPKGPDLSDYDHIFKEKNK